MNYPKKCKHIYKKYKILRNKLTKDVKELDRKSTRLNSSHGYISYAVFCLKKKMSATHPADVQFPVDRQDRRGPARRRQRADLRASGSLVHLMHRRRGQPPPESQRPAPATA